MAEIITTLEEPKIDKWRETRIDYTESLGEAYKSLNIETCLTYDELMELVGTLTNAHDELRCEAKFAEGGTVRETYIDGGESGSICPNPRANVIFEGQKLTFDDEDSAKFAELVRGHFRKLAGLGGDA